MAKSKNKCDLSGKKKTKWKTFASAVHAALKMSAAFGKGYEPYQCPHAPHWHLTTKRRRK